jgi:hypothetical protein
VLLSERTFPDDENPPSRGCKIPHLLRVTPLISKELGTPKSRVGLGLGCEWAAGMSVPEASVTEHDSPVTLQNDVGPAGQMPGVQSEPESRTMQPGSDDFFGAGVRTPNPGHVSAALLPGQPIRHVAGPALVDDYLSLSRAATRLITAFSGRSATRRSEAIARRIAAFAFLALGLSLARSSCSRARCSATPPFASR